MTKCSLWFQLTGTSGVPYESDQQGILRARRVDPEAGEGKEAIVRGLSTVSAIREVCECLEDISRAYVKRLLETPSDGKEYTEAIDVFLSFSGLEGGPVEYSCTPATTVVLNDFYTPTVTGALSNLPNRRFMALVHAYGLDKYTSAPTDRIRGSVFHDLAQAWLETRLATLGEAEAKDGVIEYLRTHPWDSFVIGTPYQLVREVVTRCREFVLEQSMIETRAAGGLVIESSLLSTERAVRARTDVRAQGKVTDIKSGNLYDDDRQQVYQYMELLEEKEPLGQIVYWEKDKGRFRLLAMKLSDRERVAFGRTQRGKADYTWYRNLLALRLLNDMLVPDQVLLPRDVDLKIVEGSKKIAASCAPWDPEKCARVMPLLTDGPAASTAPCQVCSANERKALPVATNDLIQRGAETPPSVWKRYVRQMQGMVEKQRFLAHLSFGHLWRRNLDRQIEDARLVLGLEYRGRQGMHEEPARGRRTYGFTCRLWEGDYSDANPGASVILVAARQRSADPRDWELNRDESGNLQYVPAKLVRRTPDGMEFTTESPHAEAEFSRLRTFLMHEALREESLDLQFRALARFSKACSDTDEQGGGPLPAILLSRYDAGGHTPAPNGLPELWNRIDAAFSDMAIDQNKRDVVTQALSAKDFFLVQGPPGTGKTLSIVLMALYFLRYTRQKIRIATFTNKAALRILEAFSQQRARCEAVLDQAGCFEGGVIAWAGREEMVRGEIEATGNSSLEDFLLGVPPFEGLTEWADKRRKEIRVLVGTVNAIESNTVAGAWAMEETIAIVDEASQLTEPMTLAGILGASRFVLVGDERQLSPVIVEADPIPQDEKQPMRIETGIRDKALNEIGIEDFSASLFERLAETYPSRKAMLTVNYRSRPEIVEFVRNEFYEGRLETSHSRVARSEGAAADWFGPENAVVVVNVPRGSSDASGSREAAAPRVSRLHARCVSWICDHLRARGVTDLAVVTPFNAQVIQIRRALEELPLEVPRPEVYTVDRFQGREAATIVYDISCAANVLKNMQKLKEFTNKDGFPYPVDKKLNVALTRAREQLILVIDESVLDRAPAETPVFRSYLKFLRAKKKAAAPGYAFVTWDDFESETARKADVVVETTRAKNEGSLRDRNKRGRQQETLAKRRFWEGLSESSRDFLVDAVICDGLLGPQRAFEGIGDLSGFAIMFCKAVEQEIVRKVIVPSLREIRTIPAYEFREDPKGEYTLGSIGPLMKKRLKDLKPEPESRVLRAIAKGKADEGTDRRLRETLWHLIETRNAAAHTRTVRWADYDRLKNEILGKESDGADSLLTRIESLLEDGVRS